MLDALVLIVTVWNQFRGWPLSQTWSGGSIMVKRKVEGLPALALVPALVARLGTGRSSYFVGQEENVTYLRDMLCRTVDKVYIAIACNIT